MSYYFWLGAEAEKARPAIICRPEDIEEARGILARWLTPGVLFPVSRQMAKYDWRLING